MARLIDADKLLMNVVPVSNSKGQVTWSAVSTIDILTAPTVDAVEVVRCKDCCSCLIDNSIREHHLCMRGYPLLQKRVKLDDFCSYGERKEGAD